jgi:hypothetical protein
VEGYGRRGGEGVYNRVEGLSNSLEYHSLPAFVLVAGGYTMFNSSWNILILKILGRSILTPIC